MTLATLRARVRQALGNRADGTLTDAWYNAHVLAAYLDVITLQHRVLGTSRAPMRMRAAAFPELETRLTRTITTGMTTNFLACQTGAVAVIDVWDRTNNRGLRWQDEASLRERDPDATGLPREWRAGYANGVAGYYIWPVPGDISHAIDVYETCYVAPTLASDAASPLIAEQWHEAIVYAAVALAAPLLDMPEKATEFASLYTTYMATHQDDVARAASRAKSGRRRIYVGDIPRWR